MGTGARAAGLSGEFFRCEQRVGGPDGVAIAIVTQRKRKPVRFMVLVMSGETLMLPGKEGSV